MTCTKLDRESYRAIAQDVFSENNKLTKYARRCCTLNFLQSKFPCLKWIPMYRVKHFVGDLIAGITVALTLIPQGMAYAAIAGLPPQYGLYSAYMGGFIYCFLGTSKDIAVGPVAIMSLLVAELGTDKSPVPNDATYAIILTLMTGVIIFAMGLLNLGFVVQFISHTVISGFTSAAAIIIAFSQVKSWLGLKNIPREFVPQVEATFREIRNTNIWDFSMGIVCMAALFGMKKVKDIVDSKMKSEKRRPILVLYNIVWFIVTARNALVVLICAAIAAIMVDQYGYMPGGKNFFTLSGKIPYGIPTPAFPNLSLTYYDNQVNATVTRTTPEIFADLGHGFIVIGLVGLLESIAIAKAFAAKNDYQVDASQELVAIGLANFISAFFYAYPLTGSFSRTALNSQSGVMTPAGGIWAGAVVLLAIQFLTPYFYYIPQSCLAAVIIAAVILLIDYEILLPMWRTKKLDLIPLFATFCVCLFTTVEYGILTGVGVSVVMLVFPMARPELSVQYQDISKFKYRYTDSPVIEACIITPNQGIKFPCLEYIRDKIMKILAVKHDTVAIILNLVHCSGTDYSTVHGLKELSDYSRRHKHTFIIACPSREVRAIIESAGITGLRMPSTQEDALSLAQSCASEESSPSQPLLKDHIKIEADENENDAKL